MTLQNAFENLAVESKQDDIITLLTSIENEADSRCTVAAGTVSGLVATSSHVLGTVTATSGFYLRGFSGTGDGDGIFQLRIDGITVLTDRTCFQRRSAGFVLPRPMNVSVGAVVDVFVTNVSDGTCSFQGYVIGEEI